MQKKSLFILTFVIVACSFIYPVDGHAGFSLFGQHKSVKDTNDEVIIPLTDVNEGTVRYFVYKGNGKKVKFFLSLKAPTVLLGQPLMPVMSVFLQKKDTVSGVNS